RRGVWNVEALAATDEVILCPSLWDALSFWTHGYRNVTCTFGAAALTGDHLEAFREFKMQRVFTVADSIVPQLLDAGLDCYRLMVPGGRDANGYALRASDPVEALGTVIRKALRVRKGRARTAPPVVAAVVSTVAEPVTEPVPVPVFERE